MKILPFLDTIEGAIFRLEIGENMKKLCLSILASLALTLGLVSQVQADEYLR
ncbi:Amino acid ABC superfamily ATP binding cassette transporter, membrane protein, partial [human gut metagenome]